MTSNKEIFPTKNGKAQNASFQPFWAPSQSGKLIPTSENGKNHPMFGCQKPCDLIPGYVGYHLKSRFGSCPAIPLWQVPFQRVCFYLRISQHCNTLVFSASWWDSGKGREATQLRMQTHTAPRNRITKFPFLVLVGRVAPAITVANLDSILLQSDLDIVVLRCFKHGCTWCKVMVLGNCLEWSKHTKEKQKKHLATWNYPHLHLQPCLAAWSKSHTDCHHITASSYPGLTLPDCHSPVLSIASCVYDFHAS